MRGGYLWVCVLNVKGNVNCEYNVHESVTQHCCTWLHCGVYTCTVPPYYNSVSQTPLLGTRVAATRRQMTESEGAHFQCRCRCPLSGLTPSCRFTAVLSAAYGLFCLFPRVL